MSEVTEPVEESKFGHSSPFHAEERRVTCAGLVVSMGLHGGCIDDHESFAFQDGV